MKLLWVTENYPPNTGGMAQSCDRIISGLRALDVQLDIVHFTNRARAFSQTEQINGRYFSVPKHADLGHSLNLTLSFLEHHVDYRQYTFMVFFGGQYPMAAASVYGRILELPYYLCLRGNDFDMSLFDSKRRLVLSDAINESVGVLVGSKDKQNRIKKLYPHSVAHYTPSGIDLAQWRALASERAKAKQWRERNVQTGKTVIGMLGYLKEKKGVQFFLNAVARSQQNIHLLLSGEQPEGVQQFLQDSGITHSLVPFVERFELISYFLSCDWLALPSYYDGMPNTMLEAGGLGIPVIASNVDGMRDVIDHNSSGLLFRPVDINDCMRKIVQAVSIGAEQRQLMGRSLQEKIATQFKPTSEIQHYMNIFQSET